MTTVSCFSILRIPCGMQRPDPAHSTALERRFQSYAPLVGCNLKPNNFSHVGLWFQSYAPFAGCNIDRVGSVPMPRSFNLTHPLQDATVTRLMVCKMLLFQSYASLVGCNICTPGILTFSFCFNLTHPLWDATYHRPPSA